MVLSGIQPGASVHPASGPAAERQYVRWRATVRERAFTLSELLLFAYPPQNSVPAPGAEWIHRSRNRFFARMSSGDTGSPYVLEAESVSWSRSPVIHTGKLLPTTTDSRGSQCGRHTSWLESAANHTGYFFGLARSHSIPGASNGSTRLRNREFP
jgi:hypothetical protein